MPVISEKNKLTLWLDRETIQLSKQWARKNHKSLSQVVSDYLFKLRPVKRSRELSPTVKALSGVIKGTWDMKDYRDHLEKKYLHG